MLQITFLSSLFADMDEGNSCVICCKEFNDENPQVEVGWGIHTLIKYCKLRKYDELMITLQNHIQNEKTVYVHKKCRRDFTDTKRAFKFHSDSQAAPAKRLRSSIQSYTWEDQCFLCARSAVKDEKHPNRKSIHKVTLIDLHSKLVEICLRDIN